MMKLLFMNYLFALICFLAGVACFVWLNPLSNAYGQFVARRMKRFYGTFATKMGWDDPSTWQTIGYKLGLVGVGSALIALAFYFVFGTVHV
jgi:hypothetical protein